MKKIVAVFGSARLAPETDLYRACYDIGAALARSGYITMTGGYDGIMAAASQGASEAGGEVYGITVEMLEAIGESRVNQWVTHEVNFPNLRERISHMIDHGIAYIVMPGGIGTLQEFVEVWQLMRLGDIPKKPIMLYGNFWDTTLETMLHSAFVSERDMRFLQHVYNPQDVLNHLATWYREE